VFAINIYSSSTNTLLMKKFREENMTIQAIQERLAMLMQRGQENPNFEEFKETKSFNPYEDLDDGITDQARRIMKELNLTNPGENGDPVIIPEDASDEIKKLNETMWQTYGYNALASSMISLNRYLPDKRSDYCKNMKYPDDLPKASIVIPFYDDDWMLLMRTVHSVLLRTPDHLLEEIILVDDFSQREYYHEHLDEYVKKYPKIKVIRAHRRQGIISGRVLGVRNAKGPIIVNVDSHVG
jgi:polypeptide N-acetylgalactosaminyltransferase